MTKILYMDHLEGDFLSAIVFAGLRQELSAEDCVDYPFKKSFHGQVDTYPSPYAIPVGDGGSMPWERHTREPPGTMGTTGPFEWMPALDGREWQRQEVVDRIREFDLVVLASPRLYNIAALENLRSTIGNDRMPPIVMIDGEDYQALRPDVCGRIGAKIYFKRELLPNESISGVHVEPFPFASPVFYDVEPADKDIDILFLAGDTAGVRAEIRTALINAFGSRFVWQTNHMPHRDFMKMLARTRVAISTRGFGYDCLRYWEIPAAPGTLMVADKLPLIRPAPFTDGVNTLEFVGPQEVVNVVRRALDDEPKRAEMAAAGNAHLQGHHTARARARQLIRVSSGG